jgi:membrane protein implicated in regulation of membrane protease activity
MSGLLGLWWFWAAAALVLGIAEVLLPGFIFLGFALGALIMVAIVSILPGLSAAALLAVFAGLSLACWIVLRLAFKRQSSGTRIIDRDINDN